MRPKLACEVCGLDDRKLLHYHHIVPRCDRRCSNKPFNIAVLCPTDHARVHAGDIVLIGQYDSTMGDVLVWFRKGEKPPFPPGMWVVGENPLVLTVGGNEDDLPEGTEAADEFVPQQYQ